MLIALIQNAALLVALSALYGVVARPRIRGDLLGKLLTGVVFGAAAVAGMLVSVPYAPGIFYDGRSAVLLLAGLFGGLLASSVAALATAAYRVWLGGAGMWAGLATILVCQLLGLACRRYCPRGPQEMRAWTLYALGLVAHLAVLGCQVLLLPWPSGIEVARRIGPPFLLVLPAATLLAGLLLQHEERRERAEAERERLLAAISQAAEAIMITGPDATIRFVNPAFERITGYSAREAIGQIPWLLRSGRHNRQFYRELWQTISTGGTWHGRLVDRRKDGSHYTLQATISAYREPSGQIAGYVGIAQDITAQLRQEQQYQQAQKMEAIGRLAGGVAHDFNNMLSVILGHTELLLSAAPQTGEALRSSLRQIEQAALQSRDLTRQLLAFSRKQALKPELVDLAALVRDMESMLRRLIGEHIQLILKAGPGDPLVRADRIQVQQIIMNLVVNARDAMPEGGKLLIETANVELDDTYAREHAGAEPGPYVLLAVSDTGHGMDNETLAHVFEPFFSTKAPGRGTGLGLSTVYGIVKQSGGYIWCYSEPGRGTTFKVYLPRVQALEAQELLRLERQPRPAPARGRGELLLVVEDEPAVRELLRLTLEGLGYRATVAATGAEAVDTVEQKGLRPDLLIADVVMPGMSGRALVERLQQSLPNLKALYISGYTENSIVHHGVLDPGIAFLQKPFSTNDLAEAVRRSLDS